jgi:hypothetical protein
MPKQIKFSLDQAKKCIELRRSGWNYTQIGKEVGLGRRIVARIIKSQQEAERLEQVASARRDIAGHYFKKHIEDIEVARRYLLQIVAPPSMRFGLDGLTTNVAEELLSLLNNHFMSRVGYNLSVDFKKEITAAEWHEPGHKRVLDMRNVEREAIETLEGLKEHLPALWSKVNAWEQAAERYNARLKEQLDELKKLAGNLSIPRDIVGAAIPAALKLISEKGFPSEKEEFSETKYRLNFVAEAAQHLRRASLTRRCLNILVSSWREVERAFDEIENMISPSQLHRALIISHCQFCPIP